MDITEKKKIEETLHLSNRLLRISLDVNTAIAFSNSLEKFLNIVFVTFTKNGYAACLIFLKNERGEFEIVKPVENVEYLIELGSKLLRHTSVKSALEKGLKLHMITQYQPEELQKLLVESNLTECIFLPLYDRGKILGSLFLGYANKNNQFTEYEISDLEVITGNICLGISTINDRIEKRRLEDALFDSMERIRQISENLTDVLCVVNWKGVIEYITPSITKLTGFSKDELIGKNLADLFPIQNYELIREKAKKAMAKMIQITLEISIPTVMEGSVECEISIVPFMHAHEKKLVISMRDITDRKQKEKLTVEIEKFRILGLMSTSIPAYAKDAPFSVYDLTMEKFGNRFEASHYDNFRKFKKEMEGVQGISDVQVYLMWLEDLLNRIGIQMKSKIVDDNISVEFFNCPWLEIAKEYPSMCGMCRAILFKSASWAGKVLYHNQHWSIANGGKTCLFEIEVRKG